LITHGPRKPPAQKSLHKRILNDVQDNIISGLWRPGFRIPFETEMAKTYDCSRMTVNKALTQLTRSGLLERHRKSGTFVKAPQSLSAALEITDIKKEVEDTGQRYGYRLLSDTQRLPTQLDHTRFGTKRVGAIRAIVCLHTAEAVPFCFEQRLVNLDAVPEIEAEVFTKDAPGTWLLQAVPWNAAEHRILASAATKEVAQALEIARGEACLVVERKTQTGRGVVTWARLSYPGTQHRLFARFTPASV
jgi:GntR family histidine utilization transcriptional repressor